MLATTVSQKLLTYLGRTMELTAFFFLGMSKKQFNKSNLLNQNSMKYHTDKNNQHSLSPGYNKKNQGNTNL